MTENLSDISNLQQNDKFTDIRPNVKSSELTNKNRPFVVCFKYQLPKEFCFTKLEKRSIKDFQSFLNKISNMTFLDVEKTFKKESDTSDIFHDMPVVHYKVTEDFRLHGVMENWEFCVIRIDPNHKFHP